MGTTHRGQQGGGGGVLYRLANRELKIHDDGIDDDDRKWNSRNFHADFVVVLSMTTKPVVSGRRATELLKQS